MHKNKGGTENLTIFFPLFLFLKCHLRLSTSLAAFSYQTALPIASVQLGLRGTEHSAQASGRCFFPFGEKKKEKQTNMLDALCGHSEAGERWALLYAAVKEQELLPVYSKWVGVQQVQIYSKQRAQSLQAARHCAKGDQRDGNMPCTTQGPLFAE